MSKLDNSLGSNAKFDIKIKDAAKEQFKSDFDGKKDVSLIALKNICLRYVNNYINDLNTFMPLVESIKTNGLLEPIIVVDIDKYLSNPEANVSDDERAYLVNMQSKYGCKYFISSGHRRFKAYCTLARGKKIFKDSDVVSFMKFLKKNNVYELDDKAKVLSDHKNINKWLYIPCQITNNIVVEEESVYNDSNLTHRPTTKFEYVVNSIEPSNLDTSSKTFAQDLQAYIYNRYKIDVDISSIYSYLKIINHLPKEFIDCIYNGQLSVKNARNLLTKINDKNKDAILKKIKKGKFNFKSEFASERSKLSAKEKEALKIQKYIDKFGDIKLSELINKINKK